MRQKICMICIAMLLLTAANLATQKCASLFAGLENSFILRKRYSVVPRHDSKSPFLNLSGGYNIQAFCGVRHGTTDNILGYTDSRFISGFQLEVSRAIRLKDPHLRIDFARKLADAIIAYLEQNFNFRI